MQPSPGQSPTILVTGGSGFLGGYLVQQATRNGWSVVATYNQNRPDFPNVSWQQLDLLRHLKIKKLIFAVRPQIIIHTAALTNVDFCETHRSLTEQVNVQASVELAYASAQIGARFINVSTDLVFDGMRPPYSEEDPPNPVSHYGWSKWQGELAVAKSNPEAVIARTAIMYGPPAILGSSFSEWIRSSWIMRQPTRLFTDQYRTPIFAGDLASAILELAQSSFTGIVHLAGPERIDRYQFGIYLAKQLSVSTALLQPAALSQIALVGKRPADVSLRIDLATRLLKTKLHNCHRGIRLAYPGNQSRKCKQKGSH